MEFKIHPRPLKGHRLRPRQPKLSWSCRAKTKVRLSAFQELAPQILAHESFQLRDTTFHSYFIKVNFQQNSLCILLWTSGNWGPCAKSKAFGSPLEPRKFGSEVRIASHADCWLCVSPTPLHVVITSVPDILGQTTSVKPNTFSHPGIAPWAGRKALRSKGEPALALKQHGAIRCEQQAQKEEDHAAQVSCQGTT